MNDKNLLLISAAGVLLVGIYVVSRKKNDKVYPVYEVKEDMPKPNTSSSFFSKYQTGVAVATGTGIMIYKLRHPIKAISQSIRNKIPIFHSN